MACRRLAAAIWLSQHDGGLRNRLATEYYSDQMSDEDKKELATEARRNKAREVI